MKKPKQIYIYKGIEIKYRTKEQLNKRINKIDKKELKHRIELWKDTIKNANFCEKCNVDFRIPKVNGELRKKHPHHIISEGAVLETYHDLIDDVKNGILLCARCHKLANDSAHEGALEFIYWLMNNKKEQYDYLIEYLKKYQSIALIKSQKITKEIQ